MKPFDAAMVSKLAEEYRAWREGGCPGYGFAAAFKVKLTKAARKQGRSYADLWAEVHRLAHQPHAASA